MNERVKFIAEYLQDDEPFSELCDGRISRKTGYKWVERYQVGLRPGGSIASTAIASARGRPTS